MHVAPTTSFTPLKVRDHRVVALARLAAVNVALAPAHRPETRADNCAGGIEQRLAECETPRGITDERSVNVALAKRGGERRAQSLLAFAEKHAADDLSATVKAREFLLENTREEHPAEGSQVAFTPRVSLRFHARKITGLQHPARIGSRALRAQWISSRTQSRRGAFIVSIKARDPFSPAQTPRPRTPNPRASEPRKSEYGCAHALAARRGN